MQGLDVQIAHAANYAKPTAFQTFTLSFLHPAVKRCDSNFEVTFFKFYEIKRKKLAGITQ